MKSGIYVIFCLGNGKYYIGSSCDIKRRITEHKRQLRKGKHFNRYLQSAWTTYGENMFVFAIIDTITEAELITKEQEWLDQTQCFLPEIGFNECSQANSTVGYKHTEVYKNKKSKKWVVVDPNGNEHVIVNLKSFCRKEGIAFPHMQAVAAGKRNSCKGWRCKHKEMSWEDWRILRRKYTKTVDERNHVKVWKCIDPNGLEHVIRNIHAFSRLHQLNVDMMMRVAKGKTKSGKHRGWTCNYVHPPNR